MDLHLNNLYEGFLAPLMSGALEESLHRQSHLFVILEVKGKDHVIKQALPTSSGAEASPTLDEVHEAFGY